jgi:hypothetical protein
MLVIDVICVCVLAIFCVENVELCCYAHHMHLPKDIQDSPHKKYEDTMVRATHKSHA